MKLSLKRRLAALSTTVSMSTAVSMCTAVSMSTAVSMLLLAGCGGQPVDETSTTAAFEVLDPGIVERAETLREEALAGDGAYDFLRRLTTEVGPRFAGTDGDRRGVEWAKEELERMGFANVRTEEVTVPRWRRGHAAGWIVAPYPQDMVVVALGGSVGTPDGGLEAEVVRVGSLEELTNLDRATVDGKIVFIDQRMSRSRDGSGYGATVGNRTRGAATAALLGAQAVLVRSVGTSNDRLAHTGTMRYEDGGDRIPAAALSNPDADVLAQQLAGSEPVIFHLDLGCEDLGEAPSANVIGEIPGREKPEEIVVLAAHLDSWDLGTGAIDDGAGCAIVSEAARLLALAMPEGPRRTIRVLLTANEEFGLSGALAYGEKYLYDMDSHVAAAESDLGAGPIYALRSRVSPEALPAVRDMQRLMEPLGIEYQGNEARGGADLRPMRQNRVPVFDLRQDATLYFDYHHNANDTFDKVDPRELAQNVAAYAVFALVASEYEPGFGRGPE